ncbi:TetR/AcrR family transcriptional regulator [Hoeflea olei]|uniref:HTH tetR-type domain-containing protein n=1 Tax=Hoeflea olei TaxID=1480615 RepID=A0A1C1Z1J6_9HYPH|nr:TetR/AcrR family transcriptional regulator [Hoeflea olei]OCW59557.1 hypothetical protein AWJ14_11135 [Hoeflea olei]
MGRRNTREILLNEGINAFMAKGYEGIGIQQILSAVGVPKGSFYNFFDSKEGFALEVLDAYGRSYSGFVAGHMAGEADPLDRLRAYFAALEDEMAEAGPAAGCLYGVLSQTSAPHSDILRDRLKSAFATWRDNLTQLLSEARERGQLRHTADVSGLADAIIDGYEGALLRMRAEGDIAPVARFRQITLEALLAAAAPQK